MTHGSSSLGTFTFRVPALYRAPDPSGSDISIRDDDPGTRAVAAFVTRDVVLVIDDDSAQRELMSRFLEREKFVPKTASDGISGLDMARRLKPKAILLDVMMPGIDGWAVLTALKADENLKATPVIMVSFVNERGLTASLGAADYVSKPVK